MYLFYFNTVFTIFHIMILIKIIYRFGYKTHLLCKINNQIIVDIF